MSEQTKHTLGPWKRAPIHGCMVYAGEQLIADTWHERKTAEERDRDLADAWLISAAPDLLAACEMAIDRPGWQPIPEDERDIIRAALAKARGEA